MMKHYFSHEQYSGYHSKFKTTDLEIFDLIHEMSEKFSWLHLCVNRFEVTNVGVNHDYGSHSETFTSLRIGVSEFIEKQWFRDFLFLLIKVYKRLDFSIKTSDP